MKAIDKVLCVLVIAALALLFYTAVMYLLFTTQPYDDKIAALEAEAVRVEAQTAAREEELDEQIEQLQEDLAQISEEGAAAAEALATAQADNDALTEQAAQLNERIEFLGNIQENMLSKRTEYAQTIRRLEDMIVAGESEVKICYWTFDDGPGLMTSDVLDYCEEAGVHVTFFTSREANETGSGDVDEPALLRREIMGGHSVQNHTNSHQYSMVAGNLYTQGIDSFREQVRLQDEWIYENTGVKPDIFRFPGGSAWAFRAFPREELESVLSDLGYEWIDWHCDVMDNLHSNPDAATVYSRAWYQVRQIHPSIVVMLSHDWNVNTYWGFRRAVPALQEIGFVFLPLFSESWAIDNTTIVFS